MLPSARRRSTARAAALTLIGAVLVAPQLAVRPSGAQEPTTTPTPTLAFAVGDPTTQTSSIWLSDVDGSNRRVLVSDSGGTFTYSEPAISPDGTKVAYASDHGNLTGTWHIWVRNIDGTGTPLQLTTVERFDYDPAWSPDGTTIVFAGYAGGDCSNLYLVAAAGGSARKLVEGTCAHAPTYAPSGRLIAFTTENTTPRVIATITAGGKSRQTLAGTSWGSAAAWSPDGSRVAFSHRLPDSTVSALRTVPARGGAATEIVAPSGAYNQWPAWAPDGERIYFDRCVENVSTGYCPGNVWRVDPDVPGSAVRIAGTPEDEYTVSVSGPPLANPDTTPPGPVGNLVVTSVSAFAAHLSWTKPAGGDLAEIVLRVGAAGGPAPTTVTSGGTSYQGLASMAAATFPMTSEHYFVTAFAVDGAGNVSPGVSIQTQPIQLPRPNLNSPYYDVTSYVTAGLPISLWFTGFGESWDVDYSVSSRTASGAWTRSPFMRWKTATTDQRGTFGLNNIPRAVVQGATYDFRVTGRNAYGHPAVGTERAVVPLDDRSPAMVYGSGWLAGTASGRWLGTYHGTARTGATMTLTADTSKFNIIGDLCPTCGTFDVYIDGGWKARIDTYWPDRLITKSPLGIWAFKDVRRRTIKIVARGRGRGTGAGIRIDGIAVFR